jgi:hypothetical protein
MLKNILVKYKVFSAIICKINNELPNGTAFLTNSPLVAKLNNFRYLKANMHL